MGKKKLRNKALPTTNAKSVGDRPGNTTKYQSALPPSRTTMLLWGAGMLTLGTLAYSNSFHAGFHLDDTSFIVNNPSIRQVADLWGTGKGVLTFHSRYMAFISFALNYHFNGLDVFGYHLVNFIIHTISAFLVWGIGLALFRTPRLTDTPLARTQARYVLPFLAALIFYVHPLNTQAITYISQRFESMASMFYLAAVFLFIQGRLLRSFPMAAFSLIGALGCAVAGMLTKEIVITLPIMVVLLEYVLFQTNTAFKRSIPWHIILPAGALLLIIPFFFNWGLAGLFEPIRSGNHENEMFNGYEYILTQLRVLSTFIRLIFIPVGQNIAHDFPKSAGLFNPFSTFLCLAFLGGLLWAAWKARISHILVSLGIWWFFITLAVNFVPRMFVIFEHKVYLSGIGLYWAALALLFHNNKNLKMKTIAVACVALVLAGLTYARNNVWRDEYSLWSDAVKKSPHMYMPHLNLGRAHMLEKNDPLSAIDEFNEALKILPTGFAALSNRGVLRMTLKDSAGALADLNKSIELRPEEPDAYQNRGVYYRDHGAFDKSVADFTKLIELRPGNDAPHLNIAETYSRMGQYEKAQEHLTTAIKLNPRNPDGLAGRALLNHRRQKFTEALTDYNQAINLDPTNYVHYANRGNLYSDMKRFAESIADYKKALQIAPNISGIYFNLGNTLSNQGNLDEALVYYTKASEVEPTSANGYLGRANIFLLKKDIAQAQKEFEKAAALNPHDPEIAANLSKLRAMMTMTEKGTLPFLKSPDGKK